MKGKRLLDGILRCCHRDDRDVIGMIIREQDIRLPISFNFSFDISNRNRIMSAD